MGKVLALSVVTCLLPSKLRFLHRHLAEEPQEPQRDGWNTCMACSACMGTQAQLLFCQGGAYEVWEPKT